MRLPYIKVPIWVPVLVMGAWLLSGSSKYSAKSPSITSKAVPVAAAHFSGVDHAAVQLPPVAASNDGWVEVDRLHDVAACIDRTMCKARNPSSLKLNLEQLTALHAERWYLAVTLRNNAELMDHLLHELLVAVSVLSGGNFSSTPVPDRCSSGGGAGGRLRAAGGGSTTRHQQPGRQPPKPGNVYVSILESNSGDATPAYLSMYDDVLGVAGVPHTVLSTLALTRLREQGKLDAFVEQGARNEERRRGRRRRLQEEREEGEMEDESRRDTAADEGDGQRPPRGPSGATASDVLGRALSSHPRLRLVTEQDGYEGAEDADGPGEGLGLLRLDSSSLSGADSDSDRSQQGQGSRRGGGGSSSRRFPVRTAAPRRAAGTASTTTAATHGRVLAPEDPAAAAQADRIIFSVGSSEKWSGNRIAFLARMRNWVMRPLYDSAKAWRDAVRREGKGTTSSSSGSGEGGSSDGSTTVGDAGTSTGGGGGKHGWPSTPRDGPVPFTRIIFLNDAYFCAEDVIRLALHTVGPAGSTGIADAVCGLDFDTTSVHRTGFYDMWVARDKHGSEFSKSPPFMKREKDAAELVQGKPVPVFCCWNGAVAATARPFYEGVPVDVPRGSPAGPVQFRRGRQGECAASECSLFCKDFWAAGAGKFLIDPHVRLAYERDTWAWVATKEVNWMDQDAKEVERHGETTWPFAGEFPLHPPGRVFCCGLEGGGRGPDQGCINEPLRLPGAAAAGEG